MSSVELALAAARHWPVFPATLVPDPRPDDPDHLFIGAVSQLHKPITRPWRRTAKNAPTREAPATMNSMTSIHGPRQPRGHLRARPPAVRVGDYAVARAV